MTRLFAGTPWDRPPTCDRCGRLEAECSCVPLVPDTKRIPPEVQTARPRPSGTKGKLVTVITGLVADGNDLNDVATQLENSVRRRRHRQGREIELQGDHLLAAERTLQRLGFKTKIRGA